MPSNHATHLDLLAQVADSTHERDEVRRILSAAAIRSIDTAISGPMPLDTFAGCHGPCSQGRRFCPTPDACQIAEPDTFAIWRGLRVAIAFTAGCVVLALCLAYWLKS